MKYDVIVVGAGASGAPLAARLSEDPARSLLLLEAGPVPATTETFPTELLNAVTVQGARPDHPNNWSFESHLTPDRPYSTARGRILGGSSTINGTYFVRARKRDFDRWAANGNNEWDWERVLPLYRRLESDHQYGESAIHGGSGPMPVNRAPLENPIAIAFANAATELGFAAEPDKNDQRAPGVGPIPMNVSDGIRVNTGIAYINPARARKNLTVLGDTYVLRVLFRGQRAVGVEVMSNGIVSVIEGDEIVLAAGGVKSPHILLVSGIGPRAALEHLGIPVVADLPVGADFSDHPQVSLSWEPRAGLEENSTAPAMQVCLNFATHGSEHESDVEIIPWLKSSRDLLDPIQIDHHAVRPGELTLLVSLQAPVSRGQITLQSADPSVQPRIDYNYLGESEDLFRLREGLRVAVSIVRSEPFRPLAERVTNPTETILCDDHLLDEWIRETLGTAFHLCGSAKLGNTDDPTSVVDQYGRVHGIEGLRVADTSILPTAPTRGPAATAVLIGEMVADFMKRNKAK